MKNYITVDTFIRRMPKEMIQNVQFVIVYFKDAQQHYAYYKFVRPLLMRVVLKDNSVKQLDYIDLLHVMEHEEFIGIHEKAYELLKREIDAKGLYKLVISTCMKIDISNPHGDISKYDYFIKEIVDVMLPRRIIERYAKEYRNIESESEACHIFAYNDEDEKY